MEAPRVFISYSHDSVVHKRWVESLAFALRKDFGIDVILDVWDLKLGSVLPKFMETLTEADRVLMICTDNYCDKCNHDDKSGVAYEKLLMSAELMGNIYGNTLIQILRDNQGGKLPKFVGSRLYADFRDDANFYDELKKLAADIHGVEFVKPALGKNPFVQGYDINFGQDGVCVLPFRMFNAIGIFQLEERLLISGTINGKPKIAALTADGEIDKSFGCDGLLSMDEPGLPYGKSADTFYVNDVIARQDEILVVPRFDLGGKNTAIARFNYEGRFLEFENFGSSQLSCFVYNGMAPAFLASDEMEIAIFDDTVNAQDGNKAPILVKLNDPQGITNSWVQCHPVKDFIYCYGKKGSSRKPFVSRFDKEGCLDVNFGEQGIVHLEKVGRPDVNGFHNQVLTAASLPDGRLIVGGGIR